MYFAAIHHPRSPTGVTSRRGGIIRMAGRKGAGVTVFIDCAKEGGHGVRTNVNATNCAADFNFHICLPRIWQASRYAG